jgi:hypothetical protein
MFESNSPAIIESLHCNSVFLDKNVINPNYILTTINQPPSIKLITLELLCSTLHHISLHSASLVVYTILFIQMLVSITFANIKHSGLNLCQQQAFWTDRNQPRACLKIRGEGEAPFTVVSTSICGLSVISQLLRSQERGNIKTLLSLWSSLYFIQIIQLTGAKKQSNVATTYLQYAAVPNFNRAHTFCSFCYMHWSAITK